MVLKMKLLASILLLIMMLSGTTCGYNLLLGGINQSKPCVEPCSSAANDDYKEIAASLDAYYFPMYYLPSDEENAEEVRKAALGEASEQNGLDNGALKNRFYETILAYSGGTATAITAMADQGVTCDTLILVSPISAGVERETVDVALNKIKKCKDDKLFGDPEWCAWAEKGKLESQAESNFREQLALILAANPPVVNHIIVIQSEQDKLENGSIYQFRDFDKIEDGRITVRDVTLDSTGEDAHRDLFFNYATSHLANDGSGIKFSPTGQCTKPNPFEQINSDQELRKFNLLLENTTSFFKSITPEQPPIFGTKELSGAQGEAIFKHLTTSEGSKTQANVQPTPVSNSQDTKEEELRRKLQYINSWFAAGAPGLS
jgi:hypothetical protein